MKSKNMPLNSISPLDGRYFEKTRALALYFSEEALMKYRVMVEGEYLIALSVEKKTILRKFTSKEIKKIRNLYNLSDSDFKHIKKIETTTNHDVKAVEYFIKEKHSKTSLKDSLEWIHFGLTSEVTNNIAYGLTLSKATANILVPKLKEVNHELELLAKHYRNLPMLARTHGQPASPTTFGKEMGVFAHRLGRGLDHLSGQKILVKLNGASGNYNAHIAAFPKFDWLKFSKKFISGFNKKLIFKLKINPINFENSEGNLGLANALFEFFARKLPISRLQRDLSDSTVERAFGTAF